ncbi:MAG TPA: HD domain-containing phosphohydrolase [Bryobacteraceae bacterium]|nr:HD domain-containing phosphohydrolase [Bryobacteraceae bacterium]
MKEDNLKQAHILIVDDQPANVQLLERLLQTAGYSNFLSTTDPRQVLPMFGKFQPDLILLDLMMPHLDGYSVMQQVSPRIPEGAYLPILVLTAEVNAEAKQKALSMGAKDFLTKPLDATEVLLRIKNLLETRFLHLRLQNQNQVLEEKVREQTEELEEARIEILQRLAMAAEYREDPTGEHPKRVGEMSAVLAHAAGLPKAQVELIRLAAPLHDVGKIGVPDAILKKTSTLTPEEAEQVKLHAALGARILSGTQVPLLQLAEEIALYHHEYWDGSGYANLKGADIPIAARIVAITDSFDVLTHDRPYRKALSSAEALAEMSQQSGRMFDPRLVDAFLRWHKRQDLPRKMREAILAS